LHLDLLGLELKDGRLLLPLWRNGIMLRESGVKLCVNLLEVGHLWRSLPVHLGGDLGRALLRVIWLSFKYALLILLED
jgi:hypothetical protein